MRARAGLISCLGALTFVAQADEEGVPMRSSKVSLTSAVNRRAFLQGSGALAATSALGLSGCMKPARTAALPPAPVLPIYDQYTPLVPIRCHTDRIFRITVCLRPFRAAEPALPRIAASHDRNMARGTATPSKIAKRTFRISPCLHITLVMATYDTQKLSRRSHMYVALTRNVILGTNCRRIVFFRSCHCGCVVCA